MFYNFLLAHTMRCVIHSNALIARKKNYADQSVDPVMKGFVFSVDLYLPQKNNVQ